MILDSSCKEFRVAFSADFRDEYGNLIFPDIGLSLLDGIPSLSYQFIRDYQAEYVPQQLSDCDVLISLKPRVTSNSLDGIQRLCAIGRCGVGYDNVDLDACTEKDIAVFITPAGVVRPVAESIVLFVLALSHNLVSKDRLVRKGRWAESTRKLGREPSGRLSARSVWAILLQKRSASRPFDVARFLAFDPYAPAIKPRN